MYHRALKAFRLYHRLSQGALASDLGISRSYLNELERDKKEPSLDILKRYAERFDVPISSLMLFAERVDEGRSERTRTYLADKALRILEWIADEKDGREAA